MRDWGINSWEARSCSNELTGLANSGFEDRHCGIISERIPELKRLSLEEKLILISELWEELSKHPKILPVAQEDVELLGARQSGYRQNAGDVSAWEDAKARILASRS